MAVKITGKPTSTTTARVVSVKLRPSTIQQLKRKAALERHMAMGLCRAEAARLLGITDAQARTALGVR